MTVCFASTHGTVYGLEPKRTPVVPAKGTRNETSIAVHMSQHAVIESGNPTNMKLVGARGLTTRSDWTLRTGLGVAQELLRTRDKALRRTNDHSVSFFPQTSRLQKQEPLTSKGRLQEVRWPCMASGHLFRQDHTSRGARPFCACQVQLRNVAIGQKGCRHAAARHQIMTLSLSLGTRVLRSCVSRSIRFEITHPGAGLRARSALSEQDPGIFHVTFPFVGQGSDPMKYEVILSNSHTAVATVWSSFTCKAVLKKKSSCEPQTWIFMCSLKCLKLQRC